VLSITALTKGDDVRLTILAASVVVLLAALGEAKAKETESADKSQYWLFNPAPAHLMRPFTTDRPHFTENPFSIDAGHVQIETGMFGYALSRPDLEGTITEDFGIAETNFRIGVTNYAEIDLILLPYGVVNTRPFDQSAAFRNSGIGGAQVRAKINLWGNDTYGEPGSTAFALLPFVSLPTDRTNGVSPTHVEDGLVGFFSVKLSDIFELELNDGVLYLRDDGASRHHAEFLTTANFEAEWTETFGTYCEIVAQLGRNDPLGDIVFFGTGAVYRLSENVQLDAGVHFGVTPAAPRINPFVGISARF
jgi:Putative MetA-pathway of phenol degradation